MREHFQQTDQINITNTSSLRHWKKIIPLTHFFKGEFSIYQSGFRASRVIIIILELTCITKFVIECLPNCRYLLTLGTYWKQILD